VLKHQHFLRTDRDLVVTKVNAAKRQVITFDGIPANQRYAEVLGLKVEDLSPDVFGSHPILFSCNNEVYIRSIQKTEPNGAFTFYCAIEEGMVLEIASHRPMTESLAHEFEEMKKKFKRIEWFIGCNCILRSLEASAKHYHEKLEQVTLSLAPDSIGFDTYGEQLNGLHINQTLVGIAFGEKV
jgi:hypothetical protein